MSTKIAQYVKDHVQSDSYHKINPESSWRGLFFIDYVLTWYGCLSNYSEPYTNIDLQ